MSDCPAGTRHNRGQAYQQMAEMVAEAVGKGKANVAYVHASAEREIEKLKDLVESKVDVVESLVAELSPALALHTVPDMAGPCYYSVEL